MIYRAAIIDDEMHCREYLTDLVNKYCKGIEIIGAAGNTEDALKLVKEDQPNLIFLDIHMPELNGFELLDVLKYADNRKFDIIFTTAFDQFAIKAFKYAAIDYLLKPVRIDELVASVKRFIESTKQREHQNILKVLNKIKGNQNTEKLCLPVMDGFQLVETNSVLYLSADGSYTKIFLEDNKTLMVSRPLAYFEDSLDNNTFIRIHRSNLVNINKIIAYNSKEGKIELTNSFKLDVSKRKQAGLQKIFKTTG